MIRIKIELNKKLPEEYAAAPWKIRNLNMYSSIPYD